MFELEIITLLNDYNKSDEYNKIKIKKSISNLIMENNKAYINFISNSELDVISKNFLEECSKEFLEEDTKKIEENSDFELIKNYYLKWVNIFNKNNKIPNEENEKIVLEIINFYALNRFEVLEQILKITDNEDYESFKSMLKNYLRKYFADKILIYYKSENFADLGFFQKKKKENNILEVLDEIGKYKFDTKKMMEVL